MLNNPADESWVSDNNNNIIIIRPIIDAKNGTKSAGKSTEKATKIMQNNQIIQKI